MPITDSRFPSENVRSALSALKGVEYHRPEELAEYLTKSGVRVSAHELVSFGYLLSTRFRSGGAAFLLAEWLASVFTALVQDLSPRTLCDPWAGVGVLAAVLQEATGANDVLAIANTTGDLALGKVLLPQAVWQMREPALSIGDGRSEFDLVASVLPMNVRSGQPLRLTLQSGDEVEIADDLGHQLLVASSMRLSASGVGLFVVAPSFFFSPRSVRQRLDSLGLGVEAALALPPGTFAPYTNVPAYLVVVRKQLCRRMFVAQLSPDSHTNLQVISNLKQQTEGGSLELGRFVAPESFRSIGHLRTLDALSLAERRFGAPPVQLAELASAVNLDVLVTRSASAQHRTRSIFR